MEKNLGKYQRFQEIKPTPYPSKRKGDSTYGRV